MLVSIENIADDVLLGLWKMEDEPSLKVREKEQKAVRELVAAMLQYKTSIGESSRTDDTVEIGHKESGKPILKDWHISISHTKGYAAVLLSKNHEVGIDIEYVSDRVKRIADRFLRPDEQAENTIDLLLHWCAKEAIYKLYSELDLTFQQMKIVDLQPQSDFFHVENESKNGLVSVTKVFYLVHQDYVLTYAWIS
jgi:4'-phosphopantetheinyl transferase EntD